MEIEDELLKDENLGGYGYLLDNVSENLGHDRLRIVVGEVWRNLSRL